MARTVTFHSRKIKTEIFHFVLENGFAKFNARNIAQHCGCSTTPIYSKFDNLKGLKKELIKIEAKDMTKFLIKEAPTTIFDLCLAIHKYAKLKPNHFQHFFLEDKEAHDHLKKLTYFWFLRFTDIEMKYIDFDTFWIWCIGVAVIPEGQLYLERAAFFNSI